MEPKFTISNVFDKAWKCTKSQLWILVGLLVGYTIIWFTLRMFAMPVQYSRAGIVVVGVVSTIVSIVFTLGYTKNMFQALDGIEPQFSAYGQQSRKILTYFLASLLMSVIVLIGLCLFIIPGIYLALRLQFYQALIVEEDAGTLESLKRSWAITSGETSRLFLLWLAMLGILVVGLALFVVGVLLALPVTYMMYCETFRRLNPPLAMIEEA